MRKNRIIKILSIALCVLSLTFVYAGCNNGDDKDSSNSAQIEGGNSGDTAFAGDIEIHVRYKLKYGGFTEEWYGDKTKEAELISSQTELIDYILKMYESNSDGILNEMDKAYDPVFFETNTLIPTYLVSPFVLDTFDVTVSVPEISENAMTLKVYYNVDNQEVMV